MSHCADGDEEHSGYVSRQYSSGGGYNGRPSQASYANAHEQSMDLMFEETEEEVRAGHGDEESDGEGEEEGGEDGEFAAVPPRPSQIPRAIPVDDPTYQAVARFSVPIVGSMSKLSGGDSPAMLEWRPSDHTKMFDRPASFRKTEGMRAPDFRRGAIAKVVLTTMQNEFPFEMVAVVKDGASFLNQMWSGNQKVFCRIPANTSPCVVCNEEIYTMDPVFSTAQYRRYGFVDPDTIHSGITWVEHPSQDAFVPPTHPVATVFESNTKKFGNATMTWSARDHAFRMKKSTAKKCIEQVTQHVLNRIPWADFSNLRIKFMRADGRPFNQISGTSLEGVDDRIRQNEVNRVKNCSLEMKFVYAYPTDVQKRGSQAK